ncbi:hypothetical protein CAPTEDRAFT_198797 [Capitella teleta]|uniref:PDZ domain-containing protein n=1 Tax=Capitella teleta TaxID=283909 RepID=R7TJH4_CAPTE|nr:hypothetical protein CAPTEDRAFT_198797 [Capitella teleta]|eukprot:ELT93652.1 hypothetical protein CAPTEDRAFT_198797 [Capitella teleta]
MAHPRDCPVQQNTDAADASGSARTGDASEERATRFGAVKIEAPCLSTTFGIKTYVISNKTTSKGLINIILDGYKAIYEDSNLFCLGLERAESKPGVALDRCVKLQDQSKPLLVQTRYPKGEARFTLNLSREAAVVTVHDQIIQNTPPLAKTVYLKEGCTCDGVIKVLLKAAQRPEDEAGLFCLHEVDEQGRSYALKKDSKPAVLQQQWPDLFDRYFEVSLSKDKMRRSHSLEEVRTRKNPNTVRRSLSCKKTTNQESKEELKYIGVKSENFLRGKNNMAKLNENLNKLRQHIASIKQQQYQDSNEVSGVGGNVNAGPTNRGLLKKSQSERRSRATSGDRQRVHLDHTPGSKSGKSEKSSVKSFKGSKEKVNTQRIKSTNNVLSRSNSSPAIRSAKDKPAEVKMSAFERRRLYDSKVRGMISSNQSLASSTASLSAPPSRPISPEQEMSVQGFKPLTPLAKLKKSESKRVLPRPPPQDKFRDSPSDSDLSFSNPDGCSSPRIDHVQHNLMSMESMEVINISKGMGMSSKDSSDRYYPHHAAYDKTLDDQVFANAQNEHGIIYDDMDDDSETYPVEIKSTTTLKKIINDLRDAASKTNEGSSESHYHTSSSAKSYEIPHSRSYSSESTNVTPDPNSIQRRNRELGHPTLHCILKYCNFIVVTIQRSALPLFGLHLFQSVFTSKDHSHLPNHQPVFHTPSGRKPVFSHRTSAFIPVEPSGEQESYETLSLVAIDSFQHSENCSQLLYEGDYIIEVNGHYVAASSVEQVNLAISYSSSNLHLVIARPKTLTNAPANQFEADEDCSRSAEKLRLKYDILQADAEKYLDMIAELKVAVKRKDCQIASLESETQHLKKMVDEVQSRSRLKADAIQNRLERLTNAVRQRDERITQLRDLLVQQTEIMQLDGRYRSDDGLESEERVSAV